MPECQTRRLQVFKLQRKEVRQFLPMPSAFLMIDPTWLSICVATDEMIERTGDYHHVFLEGIYTIGVFGDITLVQLLMGS